MALEIIISCPDCHRPIVFECDEDNGDYHIGIGDERGRKCFNCGIWVYVSGYLHVEYSGE